MVKHPSSGETEQKHIVWCLFVIMNKMKEIKSRRWNSVLHIWQDVCTQQSEATPNAGQIRKHWHSSRAETPPPSTPPQSSPLNVSCNESLIGSSPQPRRHSRMRQSASVNIELSSKYWIHDWLNNSIWRLWRADAHEAADWISKQRSCASPCSPPALPWQSAGGCLILVLCVK